MIESKLNINIQILPWNLAIFVKIFDDVKQLFSSTKFEINLFYRAGQIYLHKPDFSGAQFYLRARWGLQKKGEKNQSRCVRLFEKQLETIIFVLNKACGYHFYCNSVKSFCNKAFAV